MSSGKLQMPASYIRLNNEPLDISYTFDSLLEAKKYVAGIDNTKGTPFRGQIISVHNIGDENKISSTFKLESAYSSSSEDTRANHIRMTLVEAKRLDTGTIITPQNFVIKTFNNRKWLMIFHQNVKDFSGNVLAESKMAIIDTKLCDNIYSFSILSIADVFCNDNSTCTIKIVKTNNNGISGSSDKTDQTKDTILQITNKPTLKSNPSCAFSYTGNKLTSSIGEISYDGTNDANLANATEVYLDITEYLARNGVS